MFEIVLNKKISDLRISIVMVWQCCSTKFLKGEFCKKQIFLYQARCSAYIAKGIQKKFFWIKAEFFFVTQQNKNSIEMMVIVMGDDYCGVIRGCLEFKISIFFFLKRRIEKPPSNYNLSSIFFMTLHCTIENGKQNFLTPFLCAIFMRWI